MLNGSGGGKQRAIMIAVLACAGTLETVAHGLELGPANITGNVGYSYRTLSVSDGTDTRSSEFLANLNLHSYLWRPWLATTDVALTLADDQGHYNNGSADARRSLTGDVALNFLPQSRTPFSVHYFSSNTRLDNLRVSDAPVTFEGVEFDTQRWDVRGSLLTQDGGRLFAHYDTSEWISNLGEYTDSLYGVEWDHRWSQQHLLAKINYGTNDYQRVADFNQHQKTLNFDLTHNWSATADLRFDNKASFYNFEREFTPNAGTISPTPASPSTSTTEIAQLSSFFFWRPQENPLTMSGGVRLYQMTGTSDTTANDALNTSGNLGLFYQFTPQIRFDINGGFIYSDSNNINRLTTNVRGGAQYQSDLRDLSGGATYQFYGNAYGSRQSDGDADTSEAITVTAGHNAQKAWFNDEFSSWRLSLNQSLGFTGQASVDPTLRLDHNATLAWNRLGLNGANSLAQVTLTDSRDMGENQGSQQLLNFQLLRNQPITNASQLSGNITVQYVRLSYPDYTTVSTAQHDYTTATGRLDYMHNSIFGIPRLRFGSNLFVSKATGTDWLDRAEWDNRLDYLIGLLDVSLVARWMSNDGLNSQLYMFRLARRF